MANVTVQQAVAKQNTATELRHNLEAQLAANPSNRALRVAFAEAEVAETEAYCQALDARNAERRERSELALDDAVVDPQGEEGIVLSLFTEGGAPMVEIRYDEDHGTGVWHQADVRSKV